MICNFEGIRHLCFLLYTIILQPLLINSEHFRVIGFLGNILVLLLWDSISSVFFGGWGYGVMILDS
jgi:hypothetical protein